MQKLRPTKPEEYDIQFLFLIELINVFTKSLAIGNRLFYYKINKGIRHNPILNDLSFNKNGIISSVDGLAEFFDAYKESRKSSLYSMSPYFSSLLRLLGLIYESASKILGREETKNIFKNSFYHAKNKYHFVPDLSGYIPSETLGLSSIFFSAYPFSVRIMDNLIDYLINSIIKKGGMPEKPFPAKKLSREELSAQVKGIYIELLGHSGEKYFKKIEKEMSISAVEQQVSWLKKANILTDKEAEDLRLRISHILKSHAKTPLEISPEELTLSGFILEETERGVK